MQAFGHNECWNRRKISTSEERLIREGGKSVHRISGEKLTASV